MSARILIIDDEESMCNFMEIMLAKEGYRVDSVTSPKEGISRLRKENYDLTIVDLNMPEMSGLDVLQEIRSFKSDQDMLVMTAYASVDTAIEAMKRGASDYITKPFKVDEIKLIIEKNISHARLRTENVQLKKQLATDNSFDKFIGSSEIVTQLKQLARQIAATESTVLIRGESGTGKDLVAKAIHHHSNRANGPFVTINCGALPENLLESELFGHKKGSFTGAIKDKDGLFKVADGGTFFLDEVGNMPVSVQVKLLRVLEDQLITPVGDTKPIHVNVRLIAATNADLEADVKAGSFREDLFYRLNVIPVYIPPLRDRRDDLDLLVEHFLTRIFSRQNREPKPVSDEAMQLLRNYRWPGNVRELENTLERAALLSKGERIDISDFPEKMAAAQPTEQSPLQNANPSQLSNSDEPLLNPTLESIEKAYIHFVMSQTDGNKAEAARILGIDTSTLYRKIERYGLKEQFAAMKSKPGNK